MPLSSWWNRLRRAQEPQTLGNKEVEALLGDSPSLELIEELSSFGDLMVGDVTDTTAAIDGKATAALGWAGVPLGFLIVGSPDWIKTNSWWVVIFASATIAFSVVTICTAGLALRTRNWQFASEIDWFRQDLFSTPDKLKTYHVISKLNAHRDGALQNARKGLWLVRTEAALSAALLLMGAMALAQTWALFLRGLV